MNHRLIGAAFALAAAISIAREAGAASATDGIFTEEQAKRGEEIYQGTCTGCHGEKLVSKDPDFPTLAKPAFNFTWVRKTIAERLDRVRAMPPGAGGSFSDQEYLDVIAYILHFNGYPAGETELTPDLDLKSITINKQ